MIKIDSLSHRFGDDFLFRELSVELEDGIHALIGKSGSGKTTLLRIIAGLLEPTEGKVTYDGGISVSFQENRLFPWYTAQKNVAIVSDKETAESLLTELGLEDALNKHPSELSGGMKRRVSLARALGAPSKVVLLDEPFAGLDDSTAAQTLEVIRKHTGGKVVLISTHNLAIAEMLDSTIEITKPSE